MTLSSRRTLVPLRPVVLGSGLAHAGGYPFKARYSDEALVRARAAAADEEKSSHSLTRSPKETVKPSAASFRSASARTWGPMIASDREGAITRTDEPERSLGGTTGTSPY